MNPISKDGAGHAADAATHHWNAVIAAARSHAPDLYLSALLAPRAARRDLVTLAAYLGEVSRILLTVREPRLAEIRLQWWRETLETAVSSSTAIGSSGHPVADSMAALLRRDALPLSDVLAPIDAGDHLLGMGTLSVETELAGFIEATGVIPFRLASRLIGGTSNGDGAMLLSSAGRAYGLTRLAVDLPRHLALGRQPVPLARYGGRDPGALARPDVSAAIAQATGSLMDEAFVALVEARNCFKAVTAPQRAAVLPAALVEPYFKALHGRKEDAFGAMADLSPLSRAWHLWWARRLEWI